MQAGKRTVLFTTLLLALSLVTQPLFRSGQAQANPALLFFLGSSIVSLVKGIKDILSSKAVKTAGKVVERYAVNDDSRDAKKILVSPAEIDAYIDARIKAQLSDSQSKQALD